MATPEPSTPHSDLPREHLSAEAMRSNPLELHSRGAEKILPLQEVMSHYACGYAESTWEQWFKEAERDSRVKNLMAELEASGHEYFQEPITLGYYPEEVDEAGEVDPEQYLVFNGMHRLAAYHLLGRKWGYFSLGARERESHSLLLNVALSLSRRVSDGEIDEIWDKTSWRIGSNVNNPWVAIETCYSGPESVELLLAPSLTTEDELRELLPTLARDVSERVAFLSPRRLSLTLSRFENGDDEFSVREIPLAKVSVECAGE